MGVGPTFMAGDGLGESDMIASESSASVESTSLCLNAVPTCLRDIREARLDDLSSTADRELLRRFTVEESASGWGVGWGVGKRRGMFEVAEVGVSCGSSTDSLDIGRVNMPS
jgi:hypothetical protein